MFHSTTAAEFSPASNGSATDYCGNSFYFDDRGSTTLAMVSTGLGTYEYRYNQYYFVPGSCSNHTGTHDVKAHCYYSPGTSTCPKGWGNATDYNAHRPGCYAGSYYPNATPASNTNIYTGSL